MFLNQSGGMVFPDIFAVGQARPPASILLLPMVKMSAGSASVSTAQCASCFGAVYCMSNILTDFEDVKQPLREAVLEVRG